MKRTLFFIFVCGAQLAASAQPAMKWLNEPRKWRLDSGKIKVTADPQTDFWRKTFYRYVTDNGHFYYLEKKGDFEATVKITGNYQDLYDQGGLMIRLDSGNWIKSGVEFVDGAIHISAVFTRTFSDWSVIAVADAPKVVWLKMKRKNDSVELSYSLDGKDFEMQRLGYFPPGVTAKVGIMAAAPDGKGFEATFENFNVHTLK